MNNKGQTLVLFVCLLPLLVALLAFIFDSAYIIKENNKLNNIATLAMSYSLEKGKTKEEIKQFILKNDNNIEIKSITNDNVHLINNIKPIFGKFVGYKEYSLETNLKGSINSEGKLIITEEG